MPDLEAHCISCKKKYRYDFKLIHQWMDEPSSIAYGNHRKLRHDWNKTPREAEKIFWNKVPEEYRILIKDAVINHIILDRDSPLLVSEGEWKIISVSIPKEYYQWLEKHKTINRSKMLRDAIEKAINQDIIDQEIKYISNDITLKKFKDKKIDERRAIIEEIINYLENHGYAIKTGKIDDNRNSMFA